MTAFLDVIALVEVLAAATVAVVLFRRWRELRSPATGAALGVFTIVAVVVVAGLWQPADPARGAGAVTAELTVLAILALPYLQARFAWALGGVGDRLHLAVAGL